MALNGGGLGVGITISAQDFATAPIQKVESALRGLSGIVDSVARVIGAQLGGAASVAVTGLGVVASGALLAGAAVLGFGAATIALAEGAEEFQFRVAEIGAAAGLSAEGVGRLNRSILDLAGTGRAAPLEVAGAMRELQSAGMGAEQAMRALPAAVDLANASFDRLSKGKAAALVGEALASFPELAGDARRAADVLAQAGVALGGDFEALPKVLLAAQQGIDATGGTFSDFAALVSLVDDKVGGAGRAAQGLAAAMQQIGAGRGRGLSGLVEVEDAEGEIRPFLDILVDMTSALEGASTAQRNHAIAAAFGARQVKVIAPLMAEIREKARAAGGGTMGFAAALDQMRGSLERGGVTAAGQADRAMVTWKKATEGIAKSVKTVFEELGLAAQRTLGPVLDSLLPSFQRATLAFRALVGLFSEGQISGQLAEDLTKAENKGVFNFVEGVSVAVAKAQAVFGGMSKPLGETFEKLKPVLDPVLKGLKEFGRLLGEDIGTGGIAKLEHMSGVLTRGILAPINLTLEALNGILKVIDSINERMPKVATVQGTVGRGLLQQVPGFQTGAVLGALAAGPSATGTEQGAPQGATVQGTVGRSLLQQAPGAQAGAIAGAAAPSGTEQSLADRLSLGLDAAADRIVGALMARPQPIEVTTNIDGREVKKVTVLGNREAAHLGGGSARTGGR